jgi:hypothetical protein
MKDIEFTEKMIKEWNGADASSRLSVAATDALEAMTPDGKRDLAAQLLRSANEAEGRIQDAPDAADGGKL